MDLKKFAIDLTGPAQGEESKEAAAAVLWVSGIMVGILTRWADGQLSRREVDAALGQIISFEKTLVSANKVYFGLWLSPQQRSDILNVCGKLQDMREKANL